MIKPPAYPDQSFIHDITQSTGDGIVYNQLFIFI